MARPRLLTAVLVTGVAVVALVGAVGISPASAATGPDLTVTSVVWGGTPQVGKPFTISFELSNVGDTDATSSRLDVLTSSLNDTHWTTVSAPAGCLPLTSGPPFPQSQLACPTGPIKAGHSVIKSFTFTSNDSGTFRRGAFVSLNGSATDANPNNDDVFYDITIAPSQGGGGGGLSGLQALLVALLALLHL